MLFALVGAAIAFLESHPLASTAIILGLGAVGWLVVRQRIARTRTDQAAAVEQYRLAVRRSAEIGPYHAMTAREFEQAIAFLCHRDGCGQVQVVGGSGDLGADVTATAPDGRRVVIQAKRYGPTTKVSGPDLQRFGGTCYSVHGAHVAAVITTSVFTKQAAQYAQHMGIRLFGADELAGWITRTGPAPWH
jgi:restriction system protein